MATLTKKKNIYADMYIPKPAERVQMGLTNHLADYMFELYRKITIPILPTIVGTGKNSGDNKGQWGYIQSRGIGELIFLLNKLKIDSIIDLGSGAGILLSIIKAFNPTIKTRGFEIEEELVNHSRISYGSPIYQKDILKITASDIRDHKALYFYEPLCDRDLCQKFVENLEQIVTDQYLIYKPAGAIAEFLHKSKVFEHVGRQYCFDVFKRRKKPLIN